MSPFYQVNMEVKSPVFRSRVAAAGKKFLWGFVWRDTARRECGSQRQIYRQDMEGHQLQVLRFSDGLHLAEEEPPSLELLVVQECSPAYRCIAAIGSAKGETGQRLKVSIGRVWMGKEEKKYKNGDTVNRSIRYLSPGLFVRLQHRNYPSRCVYVQETQFNSDIETLRRMLVLESLQSRHQASSITPAETYKVSCRLTRLPRIESLLGMEYNFCHWSIVVRSSMLWSLPKQ